MNSVSNAQMSLIKWPKNSATSGFAVVVSLLLVSFIFLVIILFSLVLQVETQVVANNVQQMKARQSAMLGLKVALGELQLAAGSDQRVTATASILGDSDNGYTSNVKPANGQASWTGVWKSSTVNGEDYSPVSPDDKEFVAWLVSGTDSEGNFALPNNLSDVARNVSTSEGRGGVDDYLNLYNNSDGTAYAQVEKVLIAKKDEAEHYFAFWVEDEAVKADLSWNEWSDISAVGYQSSRLSAVAGPDYAVFDSESGSNPFSEEGVIDYPLGMNENNPFLSARVSKLQNPSDLDAAIGGVDQNWLRGQRQHITVGSWGLLTDVKWGGLRRDLSLAFEMDGDADVNATEQPTNFNKQTGEFVGNGDRLSSPYLADGMTVNERFLWRNTDTQENFFTEDLVGADPVVRGPNWWALRDYANLYKRLALSGEDHVLSARTYYPNRSSGRSYDELFKKTSTPGNWDAEQIPGRGYVFRPARMNFAPVYLGCTYLVSILGSNITATTADVSIGLDPVFYIWNPYNHKLSFPHLAIVIDDGFRSRISLEVMPPSGLVEQYHEIDLQDIQSDSTINIVSRTDSSESTTYLVRDPSGPIILEPGEVVVATLNSTPGEAVLGYDAINNESGIIMDKVDGGGNPITVNITDGTMVGFVFRRAKGGGGSKYVLSTYLPDTGTTVADLYTDTANWGEQIQSQMVTQGAARGNSDDYVSPASLENTPIGILDAGDLVSEGKGVKTIFGVFTHMMRPAYFGDTHSFLLEPFARYNPMPIAIKRDFYAESMPNQVYAHITSANYVDLLEESQIDFSTSNRNGFWGYNCKSLDGSTHVPMIDIPSTPLVSLASFANASLSMMSMEPMKAVGNSWHNPAIPAGTIYGDVISDGKNNVQDFSWLINDALFDRYYLSGFAPGFSIGVGGYQRSGSISETLTQFYDKDYRDAQANPLLRPYLPHNMQAASVVQLLEAEDGYKKLGAYSVINGAFNVNSTSVEAWEAFLRGNRNLAVQYADGGSNEASGTPFPKGSMPRGPGNGAVTGWSGFERLSDGQISELAEAIVEEVKGRGPFMSISDFVNRRVGTPVRNDTHYAGALQAAIETLESKGSINQVAHSAANGISANYSGDWSFVLDPGPVTGSFRKPTTGIASSITQADLLLPLAPRLTARADTFRVRAYGEVRSEDGNSIVSSAVCEAVVQRLPEYVDLISNDPWDELTDPVNPSDESGLSAINQLLGRQFKVVKFRWLSVEEI